MLSCKQLVEGSSDYIDARMPWRDRIAVRIHLAMCQNCRRFVRQMRLVRAVLRNKSAPPEAGLDDLAAFLAGQLRTPHPVAQPDPPEAPD